MVSNALLDRAATRSGVGWGQNPFESWMRCGKDLSMRSMVTRSDWVTAAKKSVGSSWFISLYGSEML